MKKTEQLKHDLVNKLRRRVKTAPEAIDVSKCGLTFDLTHDLPSEYEGCECKLFPQSIEIKDGKLIVAVNDDYGDDTECDEQNLLSLDVDTLEEFTEYVIRV